MDKTIPLTVKNAMVEAEDALKRLREDFELIQKQGSKTEEQTSSSLVNAISSLDEADAAKIRVTVGLALASLYYSLYNSHVF